MQEVAVDQVGQVAGWDYKAVGTAFHAAVVVAAFDASPEGAAEGMVSWVAWAA